VSKKDYYDVLGLARGASADEIKKAFRKKPKNFILTAMLTIQTQKRNSKKQMKPMTF